MHDNARPHVAEVCQQFLHDEGIDAMDWPSCSPDLNPIEHIWDIMSRSIHQRHVVPQTVQELTDALTQVWEEIPQENIRRLIYFFEQYNRKSFRSLLGPSNFQVIQGTTTTKELTTPLHVLWLIQGSSSSAHYQDYFKTKLTTPLHVLWLIQGSSSSAHYQDYFKTNIMKTQMFVFLSGLCTLTFTPVRLEAANTTGHQNTTEVLTTSATKTTVQSITTTSIAISSLTTNHRSTVKPESPDHTKNSANTESPTTASPNTAVWRVLVFFIVVVLLLLAFFVYKWFSWHPEQRSFNVLQRSIAQSFRTARATAILERLRPSRKQKEDENEMERGMTHDDEQDRLETGKDDKEDDSSNDFTSMEGTVMMGQVKKEEPPTDDSSTSSEEEDDEIKPAEPEEEKPED
ncbi:uncharacterized protein LOC134327120 [Trichomycterus rosablanca]|uniref:uncharacterized protein LOC134327120 n=1 Tax=Trichomycterus rosablanca TaxID=2290929 RepID=UPI002F35EFC3